MFGTAIALVYRVGKNVLTMCLAVGLAACGGGGDNNGGADAGADAGANVDAGGIADASLPDASAPDASPVRPSCSSEPTCNDDGSQISCCTTLDIPGGSYDRGGDSQFPATVAAFTMDKYEVTVGRFRAFVDQYDGTPPAVGAGAHPLIAGSGWDAAWNAQLPATKVALMSSLHCESPLDTWTDTAGAHESYPINCVSWYIAFAFCAWDGARLTTEAEWEFAAAGGSENRLYPWGADAPTANHANWGGGVSTPREAVGSTPLGDARFGHADLAGSQWEWNLDYFAAYESTCNNCAQLTPEAHRLLRGGGWSDAMNELGAANRYSGEPPGDVSSDIGIRCGRSL